ncbi:MAG: rod shape-determining protein MreC [Patescibacteria group bacterium]
MSKRRGIFSVFIFFFILSLILYGISLTSVGQAGVGLTEVALAPLQEGVASVLALSKGELTPLQKLEEENRLLRAQLAKIKDQEKEIHALQDQFNTQQPVSNQLLPARIVGFKGLIPGLSMPEQIVIDKGEKDNVHVQNIVVYKNFLIGKISRQTDHLSVVDLSFKKGFSITAITSPTNAIGIVKGQGQGTLLLDNVVLSENLQKNDSVVTQGTTDLDGSGAVPGLVIGKILSIDKKPSSLFQTAKLQPFFDINHLTTVFIIKPAL